jgi:hypothetical protein
MLRFFSFGVCPETPEYVWICSYKITAFIGNYRPQQALIEIKIKNELKIYMYTLTHS